MELYLYSPTRLHGVEKKNITYIIYAGPRHYFLQQTRYLYRLSKNKLTTSY